MPRLILIENHESDTSRLVFDGDSLDMEVDMPVLKRNLAGVMAFGFALASPLTTFSQAPAPAAQAAEQQPDALDPLRIQADEAYRRRDFAATIKIADQVLAQSAQDHVGLYLRGSARIEIGIATAKVEMVRQGIADVRQALALEGKGKPEYYTPYLYGMSHLATLESKGSHAQTARVVADSVLERADLTAEQRANIHYQRAHSDVQLKDDAAALSDLNAAIKLVPDHLGAHMMIAEVTAKVSPAEGESSFNNLVQKFPQNPTVYNNRGMFLQSAGRVQDAMADFDRAIQLDAKFIPAHINRGYALIESGNFAGAEAALSHALALDADVAGAYSLRGTARLNQRKTAEAIADYKQVLTMASDNAMSYADLGFAQFYSGDFAGAASSFKQATKLNKDLRFLLAWRLASEIRAGNIDQAAYLESINRAPEARDWIDHVLLFQLGKVDAQTLINGVNKADATARNQQLCEGYYFIGMELVRRNRPEDAQKYFQRATEYQFPKLSAYRGARYALGGGATTR